MFTLDDDDILRITLPDGCTQRELVERARNEMGAMAEQFHGKHVRIYGRLTTGMAVVLGHELAHIAKSVSIYDPREDEYVPCIWHGQHPEAERSGDDAG